MKNLSRSKISRYLTYVGIALIFFGFYLEKGFADAVVAVLLAIYLEFHMFLELIKENMKK